MYQLVEQHYPAFHELRAEAGRPLPHYVEAEFEVYLKCGRLEEGFLRVRCLAAAFAYLILRYLWWLVVLGGFVLLANI